MSTVVSFLSHNYILRINTSFVEARAYKRQYGGASLNGLYVGQWGSKLKQTNSHFYGAKKHGLLVGFIVLREL